MQTRRLFFLVACLAVAASWSPAADWPQFGGPNRDNVSKETGLLKTWPADGPPLLWTYKNAGQGYSCPVIVGDRLYTAGARGDKEYLFALDLKTVKDKTVKEVWAAPIGKRYFEQVNTWNAGPAATPTVDGELIYAISGYGDVVCVKAADGKEVWRKSLLKDLDGFVYDGQGGAPRVGWGFTCSPLVDGNQVICVPGGKQGNLAALDKRTGAVRWRSQEVPEVANYASPIVIEMGGVRQYVQMTNKRTVGVAAKDGKLLWQAPWEEEFDDIMGSNPVFQDGQVWVSLGTTGGGAMLLKLTPDGQRVKVEKVYTGKDIANYHGGVALVGGHVYGYSDGKGWACQEFKTGKIAWADRRKLANSGGSIVYADGQLYCYTEQTGQTFLVAAKPDGLTINGRLQVPEKSKLQLRGGKWWTHPVIADGKLYLRDQDLLYCYDIRDKK
jgi:outer membrane protein assembly factor BamB